MSEFDFIYDVTLSPSRVEEVKRFIKDTLIQKIKVDNLIRTYQASDIDLYKELLIEDYIAGMFVMLRALNLKFTLDDKQADIDIEYTNKETFNPQIGMKKTFLALKNITKLILNNYEKEQDSEKITKYEEDLHSKLYSLLGSITIVNKLGIKFYLHNVDFNDNEHPVVEQIYQEREIDDYKEFQEDVNTLTKYIYESFDLKLSYQTLTWKKQITKRHNAFIDGINIDDKNNDEVARNRRVEINDNELKRIDDLIIDLQEKLILQEANHKSLIEALLLKYFDVKVD